MEHIMETIFNAFGVNYSTVPSDEYCHKTMFIKRHGYHGTQYYGELFTRHVNEGPYIIKRWAMASRKRYNDGLSNGYWQYVCFDGYGVFGGI